MALSFTIVILCLHNMLADFDYSRDQVGQLADELVVVLVVTHKGHIGADLQVVKYSLKNYSYEIEKQKFSGSWERKMNKQIEKGNKI